MKKLKTEFSKNKMQYRILERSKNYYFAEVRSTETGNIVAYESGRIISHSGYKIHGNKVEPGEHMVGNNEFGRHDADYSANVKNKEKALKIFKQFSATDQTHK